eukprot:6190587-Pleurochrysis_carterae.AAC.3
MSDYNSRCNGLLLEHSAAEADWCLVCGMSMAKMSLRAMLIAGPLAFAAPASTLYEHYSARSRYEQIGTP